MKRAQNPKAISVNSKAVTVVDRGSQWTPDRNQWVFL